MQVGRPTKYDPKYIDSVDEYLKSRQDEEVGIVRKSEDGKKYRVYEKRTKVKLPTMEGFALFIGVPRRSLYDWRDKHEDFSHSLEKIVQAQQERLLDKGLSGEYNSTIAKLVLSANHGMVERKDVTSGDQPLPTPLLNNMRNDVSSDDSHEESGENEEED